MKRFSRIIAMFAMVFASLSYSCYGQDIVNLSHIVQRGETLETLADRYRLTTEMLKTVNLDMDTFYTGLEIVVPVDKKYLCLRSEEDGEMILEDMAGYFLSIKKHHEYSTWATTRRPTTCLNLPYAIMANICLARKPILAKPCAPIIVRNRARPLKALNGLST